MAEEERDVAQWQEAEREFERDAAQATLEYCENWVGDLVEGYAGHRPESLAAGLDSLGELVRLGDWLHAEAVWRLDDLTRQRDNWWEVQSGRVGSIITERDRAEASRRDWAAEALRLECIAESLLRVVSMNDDRLRFVASRYLSEYTRKAANDG